MSSSSGGVQDLAIRSGCAAFVGLCPAAYVWAASEQARACAPFGTASLVLVLVGLAGAVAAFPIGVVMMVWGNRWRWLRWPAAVGALAIWVLGVAQFVALDRCGIQYSTVNTAIGVFIMAAAFGFGGLAVAVARATRSSR